MEQSDQVICNFIVEKHEEVSISCDRLLFQKIIVDGKEKTLLYCIKRDRC